MHTTDNYSVRDRDGNVYDRSSNYDDALDQAMRLVIEVGRNMHVYDGDEHVAMLPYVPTRKG